ncbi:unnamed protein product [Acanthoscelides obtectus]|uniref:Uncharacterized protein n=1 Tax=Acanthoscelides obtectus TaxID=200917 RepID=A0A9P0Q678_ACAOB|nr:unnamed protein product [Acanthoscelides obtectus]CAK1659026.1 hypothetical protein AOBTE_LOCUS21256 [Acanthoscelides obtectus]
MPCFVPVWIGRVWSVLPSDIAAVFLPHLYSTILSVPRCRMIRRAEQSPQLCQIIQNQTFQLKIFS